ncbi:MAG: hypothetical protein K5672_01145 [Bacteroidaceae bacterium]|nr:hypothetical protein [Bacteroidaceae bacterium]
MNIRKEKSRLLAFAVYSVINILFILKYGQRILPVCTIVGGCVAYVAAMAIVLGYTERIQKRLSCKATLWLMGIAVAALIVLQYFIDPMTVQVDRWSAIHNFLQYLLHGEYPYAAQTHLGGYGSPFPVWQVMHLPFYLIGNVGLSFVICLILFTDAVRRLSSLRVAAEAFMLLLLSPAFLYEVSVRSDLISNFLLCAAIIMYMHRYRFNLKRHWVTIAIICGLMMSTRLAVCIPFFLFLFWDYLYACNWKQKVGLPLLILLVFGLTFLPFAIWNWDMLFYFEYSPFALQTRQGVPFNTPIIIMLCLLASLFLRGEWKNYLVATGSCLTALVLITFLSRMYIYNQWGELFESRYDITYFNMALPFVIAAIALKEDEKIYC